MWTSRTCVRLSASLLDRSFFLLYITAKAVPFPNCLAARGVLCMPGSLGTSHGSEASISPSLLAWYTHLLQALRRP